MPSRQEKKRAKRRAKYLQVRDDVLEKKQTAEREGYHADPEKKRSAKRESYEADPAKKQTEERERYHADPEKKRSAERKRCWEGPECARLAKRVRYGKAKRTLQNQRGHRKRTTDKVIQSYSLYKPKDIVLRKLHGATVYLLYASPEKESTSSIVQLTTAISSFVVQRRCTYGFCELPDSTKCFWCIFSWIWLLFTLNRFYQLLVTTCCQGCYWLPFASGHSPAPLCPRMLLYTRTTLAYKG
ncbi:hypothetical protein EMCRGX_G012836 [Ephydatia muelleri]